jgi:hypothetical protein
MTAKAQRAESFSDGVNIAARLRHQAERFLRPPRTLGPFLSFTRYDDIAMNSWVTRALRVIPAAAVLLTLASAPSVALAQNQMPSYAVRSGETIKGTISNFNGQYTMYVRDDRGYVDNVSLHQGTIINPTGIRLSPGFRVTVIGHTSGSTFVADEIDTPYRNYGYAYPYYYPYYPYPYVGVGFGWGWGWRRW